MSKTARLAPLGALVLLAALAVQPQLRGQDAPVNLPLGAAPKQLDIPAPVDDPKAVGIIDRYLEAIGGKETLESIQDRTVTFETIKHAPTAETKAVLTLYLKRGFKIREEWDLGELQISDQALRFVQVYDGFDGWVSMFGTVSPLEGRTLSIFVWDKPIDDFFCTWKGDGYSATYLSEGDVKGEPVDIIQLTDFHGQGIIRYSFSKESGLLLRKEWKDQDQRGQVTKTNYFETYRDIPFASDSNKKVKIALFQQIFVGDTLDTSRTYTQVAFNTGLKDAIFERPEGALFTGGIGRGVPQGGGPDPQKAFDEYRKKQQQLDQQGNTTPSAGEVPKPGPQPVKVPVPGTTNPHGDEKKP